MISFSGMRDGLADALHGIVQSVITQVVINGLATIFLIGGFFLLNPLLMMASAAILGTTIASYAYEFSIADQICSFLNTISLKSKDEREQEAMKQTQQQNTTKQTELEKKLRTFSDALRNAGWDFNTDNPLTSFILRCPHTLQEEIYALNVKAVVKEYRELPEANRPKLGIFLLQHINKLEAKLQILVAQGRIEYAKARDIWAICNGLSEDKKSQINTLDLQAVWADFETYRRTHAGEEFQYFLLNTLKTRKKLNDAISKITQDQSKTPEIKLGEMLTAIENDNSNHGVNHNNALLNQQSKTAIQEAYGKAAPATRTAIDKIEWGQVVNEFHVQKSTNTGLTFQAFLIDKLNARAPEQPVQSVDQQTQERQRNNTTVKNKLLTLTDAQKPSQYKNNEQLILAAFEILANNHEAQDSGDMRGAVEKNFGGDADSYPQKLLKHLFPNAGEENVKNALRQAQGGQQIVANPFDVVHAAEKHELWNKIRHNDKYAGSIDQIEGFLNTHYDSIRKERMVAAIDAVASEKDNFSVADILDAAYISNWSDYQKHKTPQMTPQGNKYFREKLSEERMKDDMHQYQAIHREFCWECGTIIQLTKQEVGIDQDIDRHYQERHLVRATEISSSEHQAAPSSPEVVAPPVAPPVADTRPSAHNQTAGGSSAQKTSNVPPTQSPSGDDSARSQDQSTKPGAQPQQDASQNPPKTIVKNADGKSFPAKVSTNRQGKEYIKYTNNGITVRQCAKCVEGQPGNTVGTVKNSTKALNEHYGTYHARN